MREYKPYEPTPDYPTRKSLINELIYQRNQIAIHGRGTSWMTREQELEACDKQLAELEADEATDVERKRIFEAAFKPPTIVAVALGYWGKGESIEDAVFVARAEGARASDKVLLFAFTGPSDDVWVDDQGSVNNEPTGQLIRLTDHPIKVTISKKGSKQ